MSKILSEFIETDVSSSEIWCLMPATSAVNWSSFWQTVSEDDLIECWMSAKVREGWGESSASPVCGGWAGPWAGPAGAEDGTALLALDFERVMVHESSSPQKSKRIIKKTHQMMKVCDKSLNDDSPTWKLWHDMQII